MGVEPRVVGRGSRPRAMARTIDFSQVKKRLQVRCGQPGPDHARPFAGSGNAPKPSSSSFEWLERRRCTPAIDRLADIVQVTIPHVAQKCQRGVKWQTRRPAASGNNGRQARLAAAASFRPSGSGTAIATKVRVVSGMVAIGLASAPGALVITVTVRARGLSQS